MDTLKFRKQLQRHENYKNLRCAAEILINGISLIKIIDGYQKSHLIKPWHKDYEVSEYLYNDASELYRQLVHPLNADDVEQTFEALICKTCCEQFCWSFEFEVIDNNEVAIWKNGQNPSLAGDEDTEASIDYSQFPVFTFLKKKLLGSA